MQTHGNKILNLSTALMLDGKQKNVLNLNTKSARSARCQTGRSLPYFECSMSAHTVWKKKLYYKTFWNNMWLNFMPHSLFMGNKDGREISLRQKLK